MVSSVESYWITVHVAILLKAWEMIFLKRKIERNSIFPQAAPSFKKTALTGSSLLQDNLPKLSQKTIVSLDFQKAM